MAEFKRREQNVSARKRQHNINMFGDPGDSEEAPGGRPDPSKIGQFDR